MRADDGFEPSLAWDDVRSQIALFIADRCRACHVASSSGRRPIAKVIAGLKSTVDQARAIVDSGLVSDNERDTMLSKLKKDKERSEELLTDSGNTSEARTIISLIGELQSLKESLHTVDCFRTKNPEVSISHEQRKVLFDVLQIIKNKLCLEACGKHRDCW